jgi:predicted nucleic acid-binding protein
MRVLLDTNVVCDWLLKREPWRADAEMIARSLAAGRLECLIAATTVTNVFYIARKLVGREAALEFVSRCLSSFEVWPVDHAALAGAASLPGLDFEDNVQLMVAMQAKADCITSRDAKGFERSPIRIVSPDQLVAELRGTTA